MPTSVRKALSLGTLVLFASLATILSAQTPPSQPKRDPRIDSVLNDLGKVHQHIPDSRAHPTAR